MIVYIYHMIMTIKQIEEMLF